MAISGLSDSITLHALKDTEADPDHFHSRTPVVRFALPQCGSTARSVSHTREDHVPDLLRGRTPSQDPVHLRSRSADLVTVPPPYLAQGHRRVLNHRKILPIASHVHPNARQDRELRLRRLKQESAL
jgi:hypothetical protein